MIKKWLYNLVNYRKVKWGILMKRLFSLLLAVMMCSAFVVTSYASPSPSGGGGDSSIYFKVTVNYYDKETKEKIAESYESVWMSQGIKYDVSE